MSLGKIGHIVVLMLENRSFDSMLGKLYPKSAPPGELWTDINTQLFGMPNVGSPAPIPTMDGFVKNYVNQPANAGQTFDPKNVMHYFTPKQVPVISRLARQFAVCDRWFASAPCQTWPNRWFVHAATADGHEKHEAGGVTAWLRQTFDETRADWIRDDHKHDWHSTSSLKHIRHSRAAGGDDDVRRSKRSRRRLAWSCIPSTCAMLARSSAPSQPSRRARTAA
jgi:phospholipase C